MNMLIPMEEVTVVYVGSNGENYYQPLSYLTNEGTLIDPETGDDMEIIGVLAK